MTLNMKNRFIVLIDFSEYSEHLLRFAHEWGDRVRAEMLLVHSTTTVTPIMTPHESKVGMADHAHRAALKKLKAFAESVLPEGTSFKRLVSEKHPVTLLRPLLQEHYYHLVFLGLKGTGFLKKIFIGSQAVRIIDGIDSLIVAVPRNADCCSPDAIHVAVQQSRPLNVFELNKFLKFAGEKVNEICFFSIITPEDEARSTEKYLKELTGLYAEKRNASYKILKGRSALAGLKSVMSSRKNEFVVVQRGSRMFMQQVFRKYLINELVYEGHTPLIVLP